MKKLLSSILIAVALIFAQNAFADVGCYNNGTYSSSTNSFAATTHCGPTTDINYEFPTGSNQANQVGMVRSIPVLDQNLFAAGTAQGDYTSVPSTTTAVPVGYTYIRKVITTNGDAAFTAGTMANGYPGQILILSVAGESPSGASTGGNYTITPTTSLEFTSVKVSAIGDKLTFLYLASVGWTLASYSPAATNSITITYKS